MKRNIIIAIASAVSFAFFPLQPRVGTTRSVPVSSIAPVALKSGLENDIRFATYNVRREGKEQSAKNLWDNRKPLVFDMVHTISPDIIGFQEITTKALNDLTLVMSQYESFGEPRSAKMTSKWQKFTMNFAQDERNPIFYNKTKFTLLKHGDFGINPRGRMRILPAHLPRICTWGYFQDNATGKTFYVYNTHLDNSSGFIRRRQLRQIMKHVTRNTQNEPVVFMGDLNTPLKGRQKAKIIAKTGLVHAKALADTIVGPVYTRTGWDNAKLKMIDHIFIKPSLGKVSTYQVVESPEGVFPSDHRPVFIDVKI